MADTPKERLQIPETDGEFGGVRSAYLKILLGGESHIAAVRDLSETGLRVALAIPEELIPGLGVILEGATLGTAMVRFPLDRITVRRVETSDDGSVELGLEAEDGETRAALWTVIHDLQAIKDAEGVGQLVRPEKMPRIPKRGHYTEEARQELDEHRAGDPRLARWGNATRTRQDVRRIRCTE